MTKACCPIVELRQYTLHPGKRDVLIELFDREFVETQEAVGMKIIGQFRDLDKPDRFVWLRGFQDMATRAQGLQAFYGGPIWKANREAANATMIDSDNVLLLRPAQPESGFILDQRMPPTHAATKTPSSIIIATIYYFPAAVEANFVDFFERQMKPELRDCGFSIAACFVTENSENTFPALPVRAGENVFVWFSRFADEDASGRAFAALEQSRRWRNEILIEWQRQVIKPPEVLRLSPTARSVLR